MTAGHHVITALLHRWGDGDKEALAELIPIVYEDLCRIAGAQMRGERKDHTLQTSALVHEAYVRLEKHDRMSWHDRSHFFAVAATTMRRILVDHARHRRALKEGRDLTRVPLDAVPAVAAPIDVDLIALDEALNRLAQHDERKVRIVELRYFAGFTIEEIAEQLGLSVMTIHREWRAAKAWLGEAMAESS